jgi:flagellar motor component MotA
MSKALIKKLSHSSRQEERDNAVEELEQLIEKSEIDFSDNKLKMLYEGIFF